MQNLKLESLGLSLEYAWFYPRQPQHCDDATSGGSPPIVLLHEGLGCVAMWRDFPQTLSNITGCAVMAYSREAYGFSKSTHITKDREVGFMHQEAEQVLPAVLHGLTIDNPILVGHSDGASIALLAAACLSGVSAAIVLAPHLFVEEVSLAAIAATRNSYADPATGLKVKLAKFHQNVDQAFYGWANIWLKPEFEQWNIEASMPSITCPILAVQGEDDQYGTMNQVYQLQKLTPQTQLLTLSQCRHSPHFDQPTLVLAAIKDFVTALRQSTEAK
jgi:pimeloyl-ACP methyl ester carboxylesterase